jgi:hypothetical protein
MAGIKGRGGQKGRSGRKSKAEELGLNALLNKCWTTAQREDCIRKLATLANDGDLDAIKLLMAYTFGKPKESVDLTSTGDVVLRVIYGNRTDDQLA